ncbi:condensin complex subunit SMC2 [Infundibulicybe gibba]|nr:condensin complex subunit SMC2 [Infundibulicybe gibba]
MRIEELVLEGEIQSYPVRTQITGWDPSFNAITGLNGSGKSNILDAICFVLGITNMSQMRAANQQDLIYKRGQAGITKASVTIVFDNSDRSKMKIAIPNASKYLLNGHKALPQSIQTLFQSVQLNINNPNFVIMQGRITKVFHDPSNLQLDSWRNIGLNMRPQEILGMVEEAADKAKKTMGKKEKRVQEIRSLLEEEITPKLEKLRKEKRSYLQYQKTASELERIGRVLRAWEWTDAQERVQKKQDEIEEKKREEGQLKDQKKKAAREGEAAEQDVEDVVKKREAEMSKGGKLKKLEEEVGDLGKKLVKVKTQAEIMEGTIRDDESKVKELQDELQELEKALNEKTNQVEQLNKSHVDVKDKHTAIQTTLSTAEELLQTLLTGLTSNGANNSGGGGYMGQLADARQRLAQAAAEEEQSKVKLGMSEKEFGALEGRWKEVEREASDNRKKVDAMKTAVETYRKKLEGCEWNAEREKAGEERLKQLKLEIRALSEKRDMVKQGLGRLEFNYTNPTANFDRKKVKGPAAQLITLEEKNYPAATALEIAAGGKLFNIIVEDEMVGKDLLARGQLKKRVTIIPLTKIDPRKIAPQKLNAAEKLAPGKVHLALSLVGYAHEVEKAMAFVFSDTLICNDAESAKRVTFSTQVGVRSVTLDGDVYDPSGTLSGGSAPSGSGILIQIQELHDLERKIAHANAQLQHLEKQEASGQKSRHEWQSLTRELEIKEHELKLLEEQVQGSNAARLGVQADALKQTISDLKAAVRSAQDKQKAAKETCRSLERDMDEFKNNKDGKIDELKRDISKQKASLQKHAVVVKTQQKELQTASLERDQLEADIEGAKKNLEEARAGVVRIQKELEKLVEQVAAREAAFAQAEKKLLEERATLTRFDHELKELEKVIKAKKQLVADTDLALTQLSHDVQVLGKEKASAATFEDKDGSQYDFKALDIGRLRDKARELEDVEKREADLKKNLATVMKDKEKIEETIEELDRYKRDALQKTWEKRFGGIFAELLPGNFAKLQPPDGQDLMDGLEVKVRLGTVWKQSLTELSGGQRSLIALSLIMALLQFKPAPMYILDEIDAALDLSHTQHIGQLFRTRFKGSQFIVVSLKEGLFTNANVLFRARFRDGTSVVERTAQRSTSSLYNGDQEDEETSAGRGGGGERAAVTIDPVARVFNVVATTSIPSRLPWNSE